MYGIMKEKDVKLSSIVHADNSAPFHETMSPATAPTATDAANARAMIFFISVFSFKQSNVFHTGSTSGSIPSRGANVRVSG